MAYDDQWSLTTDNLTTDKQTQENKSTLRYASLRGVEFFLMGKEERGGAAQGGFLLLGLFIRIFEHLKCLILDFSKTRSKFPREIECLILEFL